jgi:sulfatase modifying factor 1
VRPRRVLALILLGVASGAGCVLAVACSSFGGGDSEPPTGDAALEAAAESQANDAPVVIDGGPDVAPDAGPDGACKGGTDNRPVVRVGPICIDATEVSVEKYAAFVAASPATPDGGPLCAGNDIHVPGGCGPSAASDSPQTCVDWCDAYEYCAWAGKHLCGAIAGGPLLVADEDKIKRDAWFRACAGEDGGRAFPYGNVFDATVCQTQGAVTDIGSKTGCKTPEGVLDLSGNAREWIDSCDDPLINNGCRNRGGSYNSGSNAVCTGSQSLARNAVSPEVGFRCCSD